MGHSSIIVGSLTGLAAAVLMVMPASGAGLAPRHGIAIRPSAHPLGGISRVPRGPSRPTAVRRGALSAPIDLSRGLRRRGRVYAPIGVDSLSLGLLTLPPPAAPAPDPADFAPSDLPPSYPAYDDPPRPCAPPLIIKIGRGVKKTRRPRVLYGAPPICGGRYY